MRTIVLYIISCIILFTACKKDQDTPVYNGTIMLDINNYELEFALKKVHLLTDSLYFEFTTTNLYDCNKYTINMAAQNPGNQLEITLGNVYKYDPFCIIGQFPAIGKYKSEAFAPGSYLLKVKKGTSVFEGKIEVTATAYTIQWSHDADCMFIPQKQVLR